MDGEMEITKVHPTVEELSTIETIIPCMEPNCTKTFKSKSNLHLHLAKCHKNKEMATILSKKGSANCVYFCPETSCNYNASKSFNNMKYLKQHYLKVHSAKNHLCSKCNLAFAVLSLKNSHEEYCGIKFNCLDCNSNYTCYETLMTHARRMKHKICSKGKYKESAPCQTILCVLETKPELASNVKHPFLLPKSILDVSTNKSTQTQIEPQSFLIKRKRRAYKNKTSETQTKAIKSSAGTQTELVSVHSLANAITNENACKKSIKTQTATVTSSNMACNTSFDINQFDLGYFDVEKTSFGTQTLSSNILCDVATAQHIETNTDDLLDYITDSNFCNSNMETQTDWFTDLDLIGNDVYSNTYTQTCNEILPPDLQFNNTHTQTAFNDILRSVGSQTNMRLHGSSNLSHNETQTDLEFKTMLEEINS